MIKCFSGADVAKKFNLILLLAAAVLSFSCSKEASITIAEQYGLAYAPLQIMKAGGILEKSVPGIKVNWVKLGNTAAIREAVLSGDVDAGFMGIPPFLIGYDKGMEWQLVTGLSICPVGLVADPHKIPDIKALQPEHRIALPQPGSIQHILLSMASEREFGDAARFDSSLVTMKHPDGETALFSGAVDAHFTSPPYIFDETDGSRGEFEIILSGEEAFGGEFTFIAGMASTAFIEENPELLEAYLDAVAEAVNFINTNPAEASEILSESYDIPADTIMTYLAEPGFKFSTDVEGYERFVSFMLGQGYLSGESSYEQALFQR